MKKKKEENNKKKKLFIMNPNRIEIFG